MGGVIKLRIEASQCRKSFQLTALLCIRVTDRADRMIFLLKVFLVAACTGHVPREFHIRGVVLAGVTKQARKPNMLFTSVIEFRIILIGKIEPHLGRGGRSFRNSIG
jgi:hypothetical protein